MQECVDACLRCAESCEQMFDFEGEHEESYPSAEARRIQGDESERALRDE
jgi:hypothetical protein